ncbi:MAG: FecR domain-containing protein, partial [Verrucomicrobia bacterium]|nr:FecR domain-containing protein [Verrucomicrobiota bacterium]
MNRIEELSLKLADGELPPAEAGELSALLSRNTEATNAHVRLLEIEAGLRGRRQSVELAEAVLASLKGQPAGTLVERVMAEIKEAASAESEAEHPLTRPAGTLSPAGREGRGEGVRRFMEKVRRLTSAATAFPSWRVPVAVAIGVALLVGLGVCFFAPTMGEPVLAGVRGGEMSIERGTEMIPASVGTRLQRADMLRTGIDSSAAIAFGPEKTRIAVHEGTELKLASLANGKQFDLRAGKTEATVARQRPFKPLLVRTPQAEARVLGTKFTLTATTNATRLDVAEGRVRLTSTSTNQHVDVPKDHYAIAAVNVTLSVLPQTGGILREYWRNVTGVFVRDLEKDRRYPNQPDGRDLLKSFEAPSDSGDNYGARIRGYVHPPVTGDYTFWMAGSTEFFLFISPDDDPAGAVCVCYGGNMRPRDFDQPQTNEKARKSNPIRMVAGRHYYVEALLKAGVGDDHLAVA